MLPSFFLSSEWNHECTPSKGNERIGEERIGFSIWVNSSDKETQESDSDDNAIEVPLIRVVGESEGEEDKLEETPTVVNLKTCRKTRALFGAR